VRCVRPFIGSNGAFGCGQCMPCRFNKRRVWAHRIMLEGMCHAECSFVTVTYAEDRRELVIADVQAWLKRFRDVVYPKRIRYFVVGEYGDISGRPHYHAALFGWPSCVGGERCRSGEGCECHACSVVRKTWGFGHVMVGKLELKSAQYIAGYVTKKMTQRTDIRLGGRQPEFARMSLKPGIGAIAMENVALAMMRCPSRFMEDVPMSLRHGKGELPLGRYLRKRLRKLVGRDEGAPGAVIQKCAAELSVVRAAAWNDERSVSSIYQEINGPYERRLIGRGALRSKKL